MADKVDPQRLAQLTVEQRKVYDGWCQEKEKVEALVLQALDALRKGDLSKLQGIYIQMDMVIPSQCEHGLSIYDNCTECLAIEKIIHPENFDAKGQFITEMPLFLAPKDIKHLN